LGMTQTKTVLAVQLLFGLGGVAWAWESHVVGTDAWAADATNIAALFTSGIAFFTAGVALVGGIATALAGTQQGGPATPAAPAPGR
jgi:hypothetical protein